MKKILSSLVALAFLATIAPAFAEEPAGGAPAPAAEKKAEKKKKAPKKKKAEKAEKKDEGAAPAPAAK